MSIKIRQSNFELLRIIAMLMVVIGHTQFVALGRPSVEAVLQDPIDLSVRCLIQYLCSPCVNIFVLISGYFSIRPSLIGASKFIFQVVFLSTFCYIILLSLGFSNLSIKGIIECVGLTGSCWFVKSYLLLYILAPVLNAYVEITERKQFRNLVIAFFLFQSVFGWYLSTAHFIETGMSTISFVGLYLLGRYIAKNKATFCMKPKGGLLVFFACALLQMVLSLSVPYFLSANNSGLYTSLVMPMSYYSSPIVVIQAVALLLYFSRMTFYSRYVNKFATCCFAIYILHQRDDFIPVWKQYIATLHEYNSLPVFLCYLVVIVTFYFILCYIIDKLRQYVWQCIIETSKSCI